MRGIAEGGQMLLPADQVVLVQLMIAASAWPSHTLKWLEVQIILMSASAPAVADCLVPTTPAGSPAPQLRQEVLRSVGRP